MDSGQAFVDKVIAVLGLDRLPLGTILTVAGIVSAVVGYINGTISYDQMLVGIGAVSGGAGVIGHARNAAGRGLKR